MSNYWILVDRTPVQTDSMKTWGEFMEDVDNRRVARTLISGNIEVSTIFLGLNHRWGEGDPILYETMVFGGPLDEEMHRCSTWEEAEALHRLMVNKVEACL